MTKTETSKLPEKSPVSKIRTYFIGIGIGWLILGLVLCWFLSDSKLLACKWLVGLWGLSMLDLLVLMKLGTLILGVGSATGEKKPLFAIQALFWGVLKIVCLGLFLIVLLKGQQIPMCGLLLGMGTLAVVPLLGGVLWSQRVLSNA